ncbi:MerR family transcriptional regulator [Kineosporia sp. A_224]|uniref:MerR family transcriptional regulator n=1 Tax=Kineosporia sp. A_224 TaxID=1962180 RepID=UPI000B4BDBFF|nr:MerR family transcriptional regulator [Kineosporia sp. A_224]
MTEYRIDELAAAAETSVRNVRVYQERGLLAPPRRVGRTGVYTEAHLARLRLIRQMLGRGYTFATIHELIQAAGSGQELAHFLDLDQVLSAPWSDDESKHYDRSSLEALVGPLTPDQLERFHRLGLVETDGDVYHVRSQRLLDVGAKLAAAGVPLSEVMDLAEMLTAVANGVANQFFKLFYRTVASEGRSESDITESMLVMRPLAREALDAAFSLALTNESERLLERRAKQARSGVRPTLDDGTPGADDGATLTTPA